MAYLAEAEWMLGEAGRARNLIDESVARSIEAAHAPTLANNYTVWATLEAFRGDADATMRAAKVGLEHSRAYGLGHYLPMVRVFFGWARARHGELESGCWKFAKPSQLTLNTETRLGCHSSWVYSPMSRRRWKGCQKRWW